MSTYTSDPGKSLERIAAAAGRPSAPGTAAPPRPRPDTTQPFPHIDPSELMVPHWLHWANLSQQLYYSQRLPPITPDVASEIEAQLPDIIATLRSLNDRPGLRAEIESLMAASTDRNPASRSDADSQRFAALAQMIAADAFGDAQPRVAAIGVGIAAFMAAWTVAHYWHR